MESSISELLGFRFVIKKLSRCILFFPPSSPSSSFYTKPLKSRVHFTRRTSHFGLAVFQVLSGRGWQVAATSPSGRDSLGLCQREEQPDSCFSAPGERHRTTRFSAKGSVARRRHGPDRRRALRTPQGLQAMTL